ncbi:MAG TPA: HD domain-containing protein [Solirubrobacteraceae bacterium]|jgi:(p)ppGpp synthase/HD superfamily hydrolase
MGVTRGVATPVGGFPQAQAALAYAREMHAGQSRETDGAPFIHHPREVASLLQRDGAPDHLISAGALHDVLEKTPAVVAELRERFGARIAELVVAVSEDSRVGSYAARKARLRKRVAAAGEEALKLFAADKISKARELRRLDSTAAGHARGTAREQKANERRLMHYRECLTLLQERLPGSPLVRQLEAELRRFPRDATHAQRTRPRTRRLRTQTRSGTRPG